MNKHLLFSFFCSCVCASAFCEKADQNFKTTITADFGVSYSATKSLGMIKGPLTIDKGSIHISAFRGEFSVDPNGYQVFRIFSGPNGQMATFRQKLDRGPDRWINGSGMSMEYRERDSFLTVNQDAKMQILDAGKLSDEAEGDIITYDGLTEHFAVKVDRPPGKDAAPRAQVILYPKKK